MKSSRESSILAARIVEPKFVELVLGRLKNDNLAKVAFLEKRPRLWLVRAASTLVGVRETSPNNGPEVDLMQETIGDNGVEPWCMSAVQSLIAVTEKVFKITSPIYPSEHCLTVWNLTPKEHRVRMLPLPGAVCIWRYGNTTRGHTGIVEAADDGDQFLYEGNTGGGVLDSGKIIREGDGYYRTKRSLRANGTMRVVGWLRPFPEKL